MTIVTHTGNTIQSPSYLAFLKNPFKEGTAIASHLQNQFPIIIPKKDVKLCLENETCRFLSNPTLLF